MRPVSIDDIIEYKFLSEVRIAPGGVDAAFLVKQVGLDKNDYHCDVYAVSLDSREVIRLTTEGDYGPYVWGPDGSEIISIVWMRKEQHSAVYRIPLSGEGPESIGRIPHKVQDLRLLSSGILLYTAWDYIGKDEERPGCQVLDEIPFWRNETKGYTNKQRLHLFRWDLDAGCGEKLIGGRFHVASFGHRGDKVAVVGKAFDHTAPITDELWVIDLQSGQRQCVSKDDYAFSGVGGQPNPLFLRSSLVTVMGTDLQRYGIRQSWEVLAFDLEDGQVTSLTPEWGSRELGTPGIQRVSSDCRHGGGALNQVDGGRFFFPATERGCTHLYAVDEQKRVERIVEAQGSVDAFDVEHDKVVYVALRETQLQEIYLRDESKEWQLTHLNAECLAGRSMSVPKPLVFVNPDGAEIDAWVMKPAEFDESQRYPTVLYIHGGPKAASGSVFFHELQVLAGRGYVVCFCNPRGSAGRGDAFGDLRGLYGTVDYQDLMSLVDHVVQEYPFVDPGRLGVMGGSYGGFMTNWIIGHTDRFRAACSESSIANWYSFFCTSDIGYSFAADQIGGTPWHHEEKLWSASPLRYADQAVTPTLFINGDSDYLTWKAEGIQMFSALQYHGVDSRLVLFHGENHDLSTAGRPRSRLQRLREILMWFDHHLLDS